MRSALHRFSVSAAISAFAATSTCSAGMLEDRAFERLAEANRESGKYAPGDPELDPARLRYGTSSDDVRRAVEVKQLTLEIDERENAIAAQQLRNAAMLAEQEYKLRQRQETDKQLTDAYKHLGEARDLPSLRSARAKYWAAFRDENFRSAYTAREDELIEERNGAKEASEPASRNETADGMDKAAGHPGDDSSAAPPSTDSIVTESQIEGTFGGWAGDTVVQLANGEVWQQSERHYEYHHAYRPEVLIYNTGGVYKMKVGDLSQAVAVRRLR